MGARSLSMSSSVCSYTAVFRTEVVKKSLNPTWRPFAIQMRQLSGGDEDRTIRVVCYDWDFDGG